MYSVREEVNNSISSWTSDISELVHPVILKKALTEDSYSEYRMEFAVGLVGALVDGAAVEALEGVGPFVGE